MDNKRPLINSLLVSHNQHQTMVGIKGHFSKTFTG